VAPALQQSPLQVAFPSVEVHDAALELGIQNAPAPPTTATNASDITIFSSTLLILVIVLIIVLTS
jgi:hypothetical protein